MTNWILSIFMVTLMGAVGARFHLMPNGETGIREELAHLQKETGLTLLLYDRAVLTLVFSDRSLREEKLLGPVGNSSQATLSADGEEIAFRWDHYPQPADTLAIVRRDGTDLREYPEITSPANMCWSHDKSQLVVSREYPESDGKTKRRKLVIIELASRAIQTIGNDQAYASSQCWSPDDKQIVFDDGFDLDGSVRVYDVRQKKWNEIARGKYPTWSTDGRWVAFHTQDGYHAVQPNGEGRKILFRDKMAFTPLWWSPHSGIVAYGSWCCRRAPSDPDTNLARIQVRRLADNSHDWVAQVNGLVESEFQWIQPSRR